MSNYTTGEMAKLCDVSVRTVQYYDDRGILVPSDLTEGGRRLYTEADLKKLKIICFLRSIDLPINSIKELLEEKNPGSVISILLEQQEEILRSEMKSRQEKLQVLGELKSELKGNDHISVESIGDIAHIMENKKKLNKVRALVITVGIFMDIVEVATLLLWISKGIWWPFVVGMFIVVALGVWISVYYYKHTMYICPQCHEIFRPSLKEVFFASHTPKTRKLTCPKCGHKGFCVETYGVKEEENE